MRPPASAVILFGAVAFVMPVAASCSDGDDERAGDRAAPTTTVDAERTTTTAEAASTASAPMPQPVNVGLERRSRQGVVFRLKRISFTSTSIDVDVEVVNGSTNAVLLAVFGMYLGDDVGNRYNFVPPEPNKMMRVESGATLEGTLAFLGPLDAKATRLTLLTNTRKDEPPDGGPPAWPEFEFRDISIRR